MLVLINPLIEYFKPVNPSYTKLYSNKTQRKALQELIDTHGYDEIKKILELLPSVMQDKYAPVITTPLQLQTKLGQLMICLQRNQTNKRGIRI